MPSLLDPTACAALSRRLDALTPGTAPRWGRFSAIEMVAHVTAALEMMTGDLPVRPARTPWVVRNPPLRQLLIYVLPFPKNLPTSPELLVPTPEAWPEAVAGFAEALGRIATRQPSDAWPDHPAFGRMSRRDWGVLQYRHTDYHWRQFGI